MNLEPDLWDQLRFLFKVGYVHQTIARAIAFGLGMWLGYMIGYDDGNERQLTASQLSLMSAQAAVDNMKAGEAWKHIGARLP